MIYLLSEEFSTSRPADVADRLGYPFPDLTVRSGNGYAVVRQRSQWAPQNLQKPCAGVRSRDWRRQRSECAYQVQGATQRCQAGFDCVARRVEADCGDSGVAPSA